MKQGKLLRKSLLPTLRQNLAKIYGIINKV